MGCAERMAEGNGTGLKCALKTESSMGGRDYRFKMLHGRNKQVCG